MTNSLILSFASDEEESFSSIWVTMQQSEIPTNNVANLYDVYQMILRTQTSLTAHSYSPPTLPFSISADGNTVSIPLDFYVFPSSLSLSYTLTNNIGTITEGILKSLSSEGTFICGMADNYEFDFLLDVLDLYWESPCYDSLGEEVAEPTYTVSNNKILFSKTVFGVFRLKYNKKGYQHTATLGFEKSTEESYEILGIIGNQRKFNSITNAECVIVCSYQNEEDETEQEILELKLPEFFEDFLKECETGGLVVSGNGDSNEQTDVYYSACTGNVLSTNTYEI